MTASTLKRLDSTQVELEIAISPEELAQARERAFREVSKGAKIPGFRPGKAPRKVFEANYGTAEIERHAIDQVVPDAYSRAVRENGIEPVDRPQVEFLPSEDGGELRVRATVAVRPAITLGEYKGIAVPTEEGAVSEEDVAASLEALRREQASLVPVDRPVEPGDVPTLDYEGKIDGEPFEGGAARNQPTEIDDGRFIPGFAAGIVGMSAGETREIEARFPDDYLKTDLAGKGALFTVTVHDVKAPELPDLDDEFAARFLPGKSLEQLRTDVRDRLERTRKSRARRATTAVLLERLLATHDVPLPKVLVEREIDSLIEEARRYVGRADLAWDEYLKGNDKTEDALRVEYREEAERRVKTALLLEEISRVEKITATTADVDAELAGLSAQYGQPKGAILDMVRPNMETLVEGIVRSKTLDFLLGHARRVEANKAPAS